MLHFQDGFGAAIIKRDVTLDESTKLTDKDIDKIRDELKAIPGVEPKTVDDFTSILYKFRENSTDIEVIDGTVRSFGVEFSFFVCL